MLRSSKDLSVIVQCLAFLLVFMSLMTCFELRAQEQEAEVQERSPVPSLAARTEAVKLVRELYEDEIKAATTTKMKANLVYRLTLVAKQTDDDVEGRYGVLLVAREIAIESGRPMSLLAIIKWMDRYYEVDKDKLIIEGLKEITPHVTTDVNMLNEYMRLLQDAMAQDHISFAKSLCEDGLALARKEQNDHQITRFSEMKKDIKTIEALYKAVAEYDEVLKKNPDDPKANTALGRYKCFVRNNWEVGLPMLAKGEDEKLAAIAKADLLSPQTHGDQVQLADFWWALALKEKGLSKEHIKFRAAYWYREALPELRGLTRKKIEKKIEGIPLPSDPKRERYAQINARPFHLPESHEQLNFKAPNLRLDLFRKLTKESGKNYAAIGMITSVSKWRSSYIVSLKDVDESLFVIVVSSPVWVQLKKRRGYKADTDLVNKHIMALGQLDNKTRISGKSVVSIRVTLLKDIDVR